MVLSTLSAGLGGLGLVGRLGLVPVHMLCLLPVSRAGGMAWLGGLSEQSRPANLLARDWSIGDDVVANHLRESLGGGAGQCVLVSQ